jgi:hypothetical protein
MKALLPKILSVASLLTLLPFALSRADEPAPKIAQATTSSRGRAVFIQAGVSKQAEGRGTMFVVRDDGSLEKKWSTEGWYAHRVFLTDDGEYLVRIGPWNGGHTAKKEDIALEFYKHGKLLRSYTTVDMMENPERVRPSVSHYQWEGDEEPKFDGEEFTIFTAEERRFVFDVKTGATKSVTRPVK